MQVAPKTPPGTGSVDLDELAELARLADFPLANATLQDLGAYLELLMRWNQKINLVGVQTWQAAFCELVADCLHLSDFMHTLPLPVQPCTWDLGAGAGLPGIPLRLLWQKGSYCMVEAREKRALFLQNLLACRPLPGVTVFQGRAEAFLRGHQPADCIISRAFMPWKAVLELAENALAPAGLAVFMANDPPTAEMTDPQSSLWRLVCSHSYLSGCAGRKKRIVRYFWAFSRVA